MKTIASLTALSVAIAAQGAFAFDATKSQIEAQVTELCGTEDINGMVRTSPGDVRWTEDGFLVESLGELLPVDDDRLVFTDARSIYMCTQGAVGQQKVRWLFIPRTSLF